jgi:transcriptional regulator with XRE-family HTH domain
MCCARLQLEAYSLLFCEKETNVLLLAEKATYMLYMKNSLLEQFKKRRIDLGLKQHDMMLRVGMSRQQYQQLESKGNPRLNTLELVARGLKGSLMFIPQEKLNEVKASLETVAKPSIKEEHLDDLSNNPWENMLDDEDER